MIVEDDVFIAFDLSDQLASAGFEVVGIACSAEDGLKLFEAQGCDAAVLDVNLGDHTSEPVARRLSADHVPFVVVSGYADGQFPACFKAAARLAKPLSVDRLIAKLKDLPSAA
ncbi:MAG: response regulator [Caulobacter sp.]|nr:response regulator [Caulobacter sp.]